MTDHTVLQKEIASLLFQNLNVEVASFHDDLIKNGLLDSLKIVELLMELENHFALTIPFEVLELERFRSVASIARLIAHVSASTRIADTPASMVWGRAARLPATD